MQTATILPPSDEGWSPAGIESGGPGWWAGNSRVYLGAVDGGPVVLNSPREHTKLIAPGSGGSSMRRLLAQEGLGPAIVSHDELGVVSADISAEFAVMTYSRCEANDLRDAVIDLHAAVRDMDGDDEDASVEIALPTISIVQELRRLRGIMATLNMTLADGAEQAVHELDRLAPALADGPDPRPTLGDATLSNVMRSTERLQLVGGTLAGSMDPSYIAGSLINELAPYFGSPEEVFERFWGSWDSQLYARARLLAIADDIRWAYITRIATATSMERGFVTGPYGNHRAKRAVVAVMTPEFRRWKRTA